MIRVDLKNLFNSISAAGLLHPGNRLVGSASVLCPDCVRGRTYIVCIEWGNGGWYCEVEHEKLGHIIIPQHFTKEEILRYSEQLESAAPPDRRIPIAEM